MPVLNKHHGNLPADAIYIGRGSPYGNPFVIGKDGDRANVVRLFSEMLNKGLDDGSINPENIKKLHNKSLVCFCAPQACHGDVLLAKAKELMGKPMKKIAVIGTAGRDRDRVYSMDLWNFMVDSVWNIVRQYQEPVHLISGGAAWADHVAVELFLTSRVKELTLHLPAPMSNGVFVGERNTSGSAANYYHDRFSRVIGRDTRHDIDIAAGMEHCHGSVQNLPGYQGMFKRNSLVAAEADEMIALTFGAGHQPADGGTLDTWNKFIGPKLHISLS